MRSTSPKQSNQRIFSILSLVITLWLIIGTACSLPGIWQPTEEPGKSTPPAVTPATTKPQPSAVPPTPAGPKPTAVPLPPALVESTPLPSSELGPRQPVVFYFNQAMDKTSVEGALQVQPALKGGFKWLNDSSVSFTADQALPLNTDLILSISTKAKAVNGLALQAPIEIAFRTSNGLKEIDLLPKAGAVDVDPAAAVVATFNRPVVALGADPANLAPAFSLEPAAQGRGEWLNTSTYIFYPQPPLMGGKEYSVKFKSDLVAVDGSGWAADHVAGWRFITVTPKVTLLAPDGKEAIWLDRKFAINFNQAMDKPSVEQGFSLKTGTQAVSGKFEWNEAATQVIFTPDQLLKRNTAYTLTLASGVKSLGGAGLVQGITQKYTTVPALALSVRDPAAGTQLKLYDTTGTVRLRLTAPLVKQDLVKLITFTPAVENITAFDSQTPELFISGLFKPSTPYKLTISGSLQDKWGEALGEAFTLSFTTAPAEPELTITSTLYRRIVFVTPKETGIPARATNVKTVQLRTAPLSLAEFARLENTGADDLFTSGSMSTWEKKVNLPANQSSEVSLPLSAGGSGLAPGMYYYHASTPDLNIKGSYFQPVLLISSRINLLMKTGSRQVTVWAVNLETQSALDGAKVEVFRSTNGRLASLGTGVTDKQGLVQLEITPKPDAYDLLVAVVGAPGEANFGILYSNWSEGLDASEYGIPMDYQSDGLEVYLYTDRPIYRPGQTVFFRGTVNQKLNGRYSAADLKQVVVKVLGSYPPTGGERPVLARLTLPISVYGTLNGSFDLPDSASPGYYDIQVEQVPSFYLGFQVAEYRKPEVDATVAYVKSDYKLGEDIKTQVKAQYFFGAPAGNLTVRWTLTARSGLFRPLAGYQLGDWDAGWMMPRRLYMPGEGMFGKYIASGEGQTKADGSFEVTVPAATVKENAESKNKQELTFEVTVVDESGVSASYRASANLHPADFYIGIKPEAWNGQAKLALGFSIQTADWKGAPSPNQALTATFQKVTWKAKENWKPGQGSLYETIYTPVGSTDFRTDGQGAARVQFTPPDAGTYQLEVKGKEAQSRALVWVSGEGRAPWPALPDQHIQLQADAEEYAPGQTAKVFIPNPLGEKMLALVTVERSKVMKGEVLEISGNSFEYSLPVGEEYAPNVYLSVTLLGFADGKIEFRQGVINLNVKADALKLKVEVSVEPQKAQPGGEVRLALKVTDSAGKPVQGEFSAALVDKAVLALADANSLEIFPAFYGTQPLGVQSSLLLALYSRRVMEKSAAMGRGGGGGDMNAAPDLRTNFQDTAFWIGSFETDASGNAELGLKLPDNLTTWVINLRGLSKDRRVGEATRELVTSKDLLVRPVTPRFLVVGDRVELAAMVHNNTANAISAEVSLQASGVELENPGSATQKVDLPANDRRRVTWWVKVMAAEKADLRFTVKGGGLQDASKPTGGDLPVLNYAAPQTFATAGVLAEAGERLEVISIPRSFTPTGGELRVEMSSSLAGVILNGLKALDAYPYDYTEAIVSRLIPNLRTYQVLKSQGIDQADLKTKLETTLKSDLARLTGLQNQDGGWGWSAGQSSISHLSAYALLGLAEAKTAGLTVNDAAISKAQTYTTGNLVAPTVTSSVGLLERMAFQQYALMRSGKLQTSASGLYDYREKLSPWARAMLALVLAQQKGSEDKARSLVSDLQTKAVRSATGAFWDPAEIDANRLTTPNFSTAVVVLALAQLDPKAAVLTDAVRYLVAHRQACGCWTSSYEAAWVLVALNEALLASGDLKADFGYRAALNGAVLAEGKSGGSGLAVSQANVPLGNLRGDAPNALVFTHDAGSGKLYYRAFLQVYRPAESAAPIQAGVSLTRRYYIAGQDCKKTECKAIDSISLGAAKVVLVRLTVTVPRPMYYLALEDTIPAGLEIVDTSLKTTQQVTAISKNPAPGTANPFGEGWNWWVFGAPTIYDQRIRWMASYVPAGTYEVTYRLNPVQVGEYRAIPAHVYQNYFPEVQGTSAGAVFKVLP